MERKQVQLTPIGMNQDINISKFNPQFAYDIKNFRISPRSTGNTLVLENEKGNIEITFQNNAHIEGTCIGYGTIGKYLILFTTGTSGDRIYRIENVNSEYVLVTLSTANLNFSKEHLIETLPFYETNSLQKIYWTDGLNMPRVINVSNINISDMHPEGDVPPTNTLEDYYDFTKELFFNETVQIVTNNTGGQFPSGIVQYAFTYYKINGEQSNIFYTSSLYYTSLTNRAGSPDETTSTSFTITINNPDTRFDFVRVYSIIRSSLNTTPHVQIVSDIDITSGGSSTIIDTNNNNTDVDPTFLLYVGGEELVFGTITAKDNTFFAGDIKITKPSLQSLDKFITDGFLINPNLIVWENRSQPIVIESLQNGNSIFHPYKPYTLLKNSNTVKHFKKGENYRFGIQAQYKNGSWSEVRYIGSDSNCTVNFDFIMNSDGDFTIDLNRVKLTLSTDIVNELINLGFKRVRLVFVPPTLSDRSILAQGIVNNTMAPIVRRRTNSAFAYTDYLTRSIPVVSSSSDYTYRKIPEFPYKIRNINGTDIAVPYIPPDTTVDKKYYTCDVYSGHFWGVQLYAWSGDSIISNYDWLYPFVESHVSPKNNYNIFEVVNGTLQYITTPLPTQYISINDYPSTVDNSDYDANFVIDENVVTFWSPDVEFTDLTQNLLENTKCRFVGAIQITSNNTVTNVLSDAQLNETFTTGVENYGYTSNNKSDSPKQYYGAGTILSDFNFTLRTDGHPWADQWPMWSAPRDKNYNGWKDLKDKRMARFRYAGVYYPLKQPFDYDIETPVYVNGETRNIPYSTNPNVGNSESLLYSCGMDDIIYGLEQLFRDRSDGVPAVRYKYNANKHVLFSFSPYIHTLLNSNYTVLPVLPGVQTESRLDTGSFQNYTLLYPSDPNRNIGVNVPNFAKINVDTSYFKHIYPSTAPSDYPTLTNYPIIWVTELVRNMNGKQYGGQTEINNYLVGTTSAINNNSWIPCGEPISITSDTAVDIYGTEGDTFVQRYNCLKTWPSDTLDADTNNNTEMVSFICESFVNIDGRYDKNRYNLDLRYNTPENYGLINKAYTQENNYFNYRNLNYNLFNNNHFPYQVAWSQVKNAGEEIDSWMNINLASTIDLDGTLGTINSLNVLDSTLISFQDKGIANILYNSRIQIPTSDSNPIEITNSWKVDGYRYISSKIGCVNKWAIQISKLGIYFIDDLNKSLNLLSDGITDLGLTKGFKSWALNNVGKGDSSGLSVSPINVLLEYNQDSFNLNVNTDDNTKVLNLNNNHMSNFSLSIDRIGNDVYYNNSEYSLCFTEDLGNFTSFYDYNQVPFMFNFNNDFFAITLEDNSRLFIQNKGDYNTFFGQIYNSYVTYKVNPEPHKDKIFDVVEFRADAFNQTTGKYEPFITLDKLELWNEFQESETLLKNMSTLRKKFRIWRCDVIREKTNRNRIRNPWTYLKLSYNPLSVNKLTLHDIIVHYTI